MPLALVLAVASNVTVAFCTTVAGENWKLAVGVSGGGRITPGGTSRIWTDSGFAVAKFVDVAVATIETHVPGRELHVPNTPFGGLGGAVNTTNAVPSVPVTIIRAESV